MSDLTGVSPARELTITIQVLNDKEDRINTALIAPTTPAHAPPPRNTTATSPSKGKAVSKRAGIRMVAIPNAVRAKLTNRPIKD
jgi:hypothetical protein